MRERLQGQLNARIFPVDRERKPRPHAPPNPAAAVTSHATVRNDERWHGPCTPGHRYSLHSVPIAPVVVFPIRTIVMVTIMVAAWIVPIIIGAIARVVVVITPIARVVIVVTPIEGRGLRERCA